MFQYFSWGNHAISFPLKWICDCRFYAFTRGACSSLPRGATPVDFAYMVHPSLPPMPRKMNGQLFSRHEDTPAATSFESSLKRPPTLADSKILLTDISPGGLKVPSLRPKFWRSFAATFSHRESCHPFDYLSSGTQPPGVGDALSLGSSLRGAPVRWDVFTYMQEIYEASFDAIGDVTAGLPTLWPCV